MLLQTFCFWSVTVKFTFVGSSTLNFRSFQLPGPVVPTSLEPPSGIWAPCLRLPIQSCCCTKATCIYFSSLRARLLAIGIYSFFFYITCFYWCFLHCNYSSKTSFKYFPPSPPSAFFFFAPLPWHVEVPRSGVEPATPVTAPALTHPQPFEPPGTSSPISFDSSFQNFVFHLWLGYSYPYNSSAFYLLSRYLLSTYYMLGMTKALEMQEWT